MRGRLLHSDGDWYEWRQEPPLGAAVHVRVVPGTDGRLGVTELRMAGELTSELLRAIPLGRIEAAANAQLVEVGGIGPPSTVRRTRPPSLARAVDAGWEPTVNAPHRRPRGWRIPARLRDTDARGRADEFYLAVAGIYRELAQTSPRPAIELAEANDVPVTTAHRWIKEARKRGFLGPGRPGKAG